MSCGMKGCGRRSSVVLTETLKIIEDDNELFARRFRTVQLKCTVRNCNINAGIALSFTKPYGCLFGINLVPKSSSFQRLENVPSPQVFPNPSLVSFMRRFRSTCGSSNIQNFCIVVKITFSKNFFHDLPCSSIIPNSIYWIWPFSFLH